MITLYFGEKPYKFPNKWDELTTEQYLALIPLIMRMWSGEISMCQLRVLWFKKIAGLEGIRVPVSKREQFLDNVYTASRQFNFFFKLDYGDKIEHLSADTKKLIRKIPADEINSATGEMRYASKLEYTYQLDAVWAKNLIPSIKLKDSVLNGWSASTEGGALVTSLTSIQYTQGYDILSLISYGGGNSAIALLVALLYGADTSDRSVMDEIERLPEDILQGVVLNFQAFVSFIFSKTQFSILWSTEPGTYAKKEVSLAMSDTLYSLCKNGYGNYDQVEKMPLVTYLSIMRAELINNIRSMSASKTSIDKISEYTKLSISQIEQILC